MTAPNCLKISPDETLRMVQELYEKKLVTYPQNRCPGAVQRGGERDQPQLKRPLPIWRAGGLCMRRFWRRAAIRASANTRYANDAQITDHYAIIPTGQGLGAFAGLNAQAAAGVSHDRPAFPEHFLSTGGVPEGEP